MVSTGRQPAKVVFLCKCPIERLPPAQTAVEILVELGHSVVLVTSWLSQKYRLRLEGMQVSVKATEESGVGGNGGWRVSHWLRFRQHAREEIGRAGDDALLWIAGGDTGVCLRGEVESRSYIVQVLELYDQAVHYRVLLRRVLRYARKVVVPSMERAHIIKYWFHLEHLPVVIPNKPYIRTDADESRTEEIEKICGIKETAQGRKIILYQGHIESSERDLSCVVRAVSDDSTRWHLVLMGKDYGAVAKYRAMVHDLTYVPYIASPGHLRVTRHADIGIIRYVPNSLNNIFCAPNKIWEYSAFGMPSLCGVSPALKYYCDVFRCGVISDMDNVVSVATALDDIDRNYDEYCKGAKRLFLSVDLRESFRMVVEACCT